MIPTINEFLDILKVAFFDHDLSYAISDEKKLYAMAKENGLSGTIYQTIKNKLTNESVVSKFKKDFYLYISDDIKKNSTQLLLTNKLNSLKIKYMYLKGASLKTLYPKSYMRSMGDLDLLVEEHNFSLTEKTLIALGAKVGAKGDVHHSFSLNNVEIELHRRVRSEISYPEFSFLDDIWSYAKQKENYESKMTLEFELVYLIFHFKKHLSVSGVGLRNVLDFGIFINHYQSSLNYTLLIDLLNKTNSTLIFEQLVLFNDVYLKLSLAPKFVTSATFDSTLYIDFTTYIITSGVHGLGSNFNAFVGRFSSDQINSTSKNKSILKMIFPPHIILVYQYPKILKYKLLLPLAWLLRGFRILFKQTRRIFIYFILIKRVKSKELEKTKEMFNKIGL